MTSEAPRAKRARRSNSYDEDDEEINRTSGSINEIAEVEAPSPLRQDEELWFKDGNVVLASDKHVYCVHRSILERKSAIFKDMFEASSDECGPEDSWEGKPLVRMVGDTDENVYHFLMTIYDLGCYRPFQPTTLAILVSLLYMSTKYDVSKLRNDIIEHISRAYPSNLEELQGRNLGELFEDIGSEDWCFEFQLLSAALRHNAQILLPMLYFECAKKRIQDILVFSKEVGWDDGWNVQDKLIVAHEMLQKIGCSFGFKAFRVNKMCKAEGCFKARAKLYAAYINTNSYQFGAFPFCELLMRKAPKNEDAEVEKLRRTLCKFCLDSSNASLDEWQKIVWAKIPFLFGLGTWEDVKARSQPCT